jgi:hypothetical protein
MAREIALTQGHVAIVDDEDFERVSQWTWRAVRPRPTATVYGYASAAGCPGRRRAIALHRFILGAVKGDVVDHVDGNGLNNTRANLRLCPPGQHSANRRGGGALPYKGISYRKTAQRYVAQLRKAGVGYIGPTRRTLEEAARDYDVLAKKHFGEFARLNFPDVGEQPAVRSDLRAAEPEPQDRRCDQDGPR